MGLHPCSETQTLPASDLRQMWAQLAWLQYDVKETQAFQGFIAGVLLSAAAPSAYY